MNKTILIVSLTALLGIISCSKSVFRTSNHGTEGRLGWKLGAQAYTFHRYTFFQAVDKVDSCNLKYIEGYPGQMIGGGIEGKLDYHMDPLKQALILKKLKDKGIILEAYGVIKGNLTDADWRTLFTFCNSMGISTITAEPQKENFPLLSKLCDEFKINLAIHNHPEPAYYWQPEVVLSSIVGVSTRIGACADIGHWLRSGLDPIECLKKLEGHVLHMHMKDLNEKGKSARDVHWGTGVSDIAGVVEELRRQKFKGMISAEYEDNWYSNSEDVAQSIMNLRKIMVEKSLQNFNQRSACF